MKKSVALCLVHTEHFADVRIFKTMHQSRAEARKALRAGGIDPDDAGAVKDAYDALVEKLAAEHLPEGWVSTYDHWGGKCFSWNPGWNAPKHDTLLAGESGRYGCTTCPEAIIEVFTELESK